MTSSRSFAREATVMGFARTTRLFASVSFAGLLSSAPSTGFAGCMRFAKLLWLEATRGALDMLTVSMWELHPSLRFAWAVWFKMSLRGCLCLLRCVGGMGWNANSSPVGPSLKRYALGGFKSL